MQRKTHCVDATELQSSEGNDDGDKLPANSLVPNQLHHRVAADTLHGSFLLHHLLHLHGVVLVAPQPLQG